MKNKDKHFSASQIAVSRRHAVRQRASLLSRLKMSLPDFEGNPTTKRAEDRWKNDKQTLKELQVSLHILN